MRCLPVALALLTALSIVRAQDAAALYQQGSFVQAYDAAILADTTAAQTLAAKAAVAFAKFEATSDRDRLAWYQRAEDAAQRALALDPENVAALLTLAQAKGEAGLHKGPLQNLDLAGTTRDLMKRVLEIQPDNPNALVGLGVWNLELTARGVGWMFGASRNGALASVERGIELAPDDIELRIEYARALQLVGNESGARAQAEVAVRLPASLAIDRLRQERASAYLEGTRTTP